MNHFLLAPVLTALLTGLWPLDPQPEVAAPFDPPDQAWTAGHRGVDLVGEPGAEVRAPLAGTVTFAGTIAGRGVLVISHGAARTTYEPVSTSLHPGTPVAAGEEVGTLQAAPSHCPPRSCLHWGLIEDGEYRDPLGLLGPGPVRLLPLGGETVGTALGGRTYAPHP